MGEFRDVAFGAGALFLLGGRSYPLKLEFFKYKEKTAGLKLEWRPPGGAWMGLSIFI